MVPGVTIHRGLEFPPMPQIDAILRWIRRLDATERDELVHRLTALGPEPTIRELREARFADGLRCPRYRGTEVVLWGKFARKQRYRCKAEGCGRTFNDQTGTPRAYSKYQNRWADCCTCMVQGFSMRKTAKILHIHPATAFKWRHRVLDALRSLEKPTLSGIVEADETFFRYSEKGQVVRGRKPRKRGGPATKRGLSREQICVVIARDRDRKTVAEVVGRGSPSTLMISNALGAVVDVGSTLWTETASTTASAAAPALGTSHSMRRPGCAFAARSTTSRT
jgi:transposase-like protein